MRWYLVAVVGLALASSVLADDEVVAQPTYKGWGGEGGQVFRNKISVCRNNKYSDRGALVIVDDLPRRGARIGIHRFTVEYTGGEGSQRIVDAIHKKPYEYVILPLYPTPQSPRIARVVLPQPRGVKATFRFYKFRRRLPTGEIDSGLIKELTRTIDTEELEKLPVINPMREPEIRKPRGDGAQAAPAATEVAAVEVPPGASDAPMSDAAPQAAAEPINAGDPRIEKAHQWALQAAQELKDEPPPIHRGMDVGISDAPSDSPKMQYMDDTQEMRDAEARAAALAAKLKADEFQR